MRLSACPPSPVTGSFASFTQLKATRGAMFWRPHRNLLDCSIKRNIDCKDDTKSIDFRQGGEASRPRRAGKDGARGAAGWRLSRAVPAVYAATPALWPECPCPRKPDRKSTRLNSSH